VNDPLLANLTDAQREAVTHDRGPLLVVAGAGTGKTRVVTRRVAYRIACGTPADRILTCTFTNKAAGEMRERIETLVPAGRPMWICTFHALGARILRRHADRIGYERSFTILDSDDQLRAVRESLAQLELDPAPFPPRALAEKIRAAKQAATLPEDLPVSDGSFSEEIFRKVYRIYDRMLQANRAMDFEDLLLRLYLLFRLDAGVLQRYQEQFRYIGVDEYQDTNRLQYLLIGQLAAPHRNLFVTGDPDQSIYSWRGADIRNILDFQSDFPEARIVKLERNYRSTRTILAAASGLIRRNRQRIERGLETEGEEGTPIELLHASDERDEARGIARRIRRMTEEGRALGDIAVFYRINALSRALEQVLRQEGIPYRLVGSVEFYGRQEIKDLLAYLGVLANPRNDLALWRILNVPPRGIGAASRERLKHFARERELPLLEALGQAEQIPRIPPRAAARMRLLRETLEGLRSALPEPVAVTLRVLVSKTGYEEYLRELGDGSAHDRLDNVGELLNAAAEYDQSAPDASLIAFLEQTALVSDTDELRRQADWPAHGPSAGDAQASRVTLMTFHAAKGLEFPVVFLTAMEEGIFPLARTTEEGQEEEERRLCYVGITRARQKLFLSMARMRRHQGRCLPSLPSRFIGEIPPEVFAQERIDTQEETIQTDFDPWENGGSKRYRASSRTT
jgi:DNA helicase-2/ATP-dependent DNA helicase PcrA